MRITRTLLLLFATLFCSLPVSAQCRVPHFYIGQDFRTSVFVSISPRDFTVDKMVCLAHALRKRRHASNKLFYVTFFSSKEAAAYFQPQVEGAYRPEFGRQLHANYSFDPKQGETLDIWPMGYYTPPSLDTTLTLPLETTARCNLQLHERCLMAVIEKPGYPGDALRKGVSGKIMLAGTINAEGQVTRIQIAGADVTPHEGRDVLANAAIQNLAAWQFDSGVADTAIQITYSYAIDTSLAAGIGTDVKWMLPDGITIRGKPQD